MILKKYFYDRDTLSVAQDLLGCHLTRKIGNRIFRGMITEVEAYIGEDDLACHASRGRTPRTEIMYGKAGRAYVYMIYGMYHCLNIVTERKNFPAAVLIRSVKIKDIDHKKTDGPGKLCKFLKIDRDLNGFDMTAGKKLWITCPKNIRQIRKRLAVEKSKRIGVDYAGHCRHRLWRFHMDPTTAKYSF